MSRNEKIAVYGILAIVGLEVLRHFTWRERATPGPPEKPFVAIGMNLLTTVDRRA